MRETLRRSVALFASIFAVFAFVSAGALAQSVASKSPVGQIIYKENFDKQDVGKVQWPVVDNSEWNGGKVGLHIIAGGAQAGGHALEASITKFAQVMLATVSLEKGETYRVSLDLKGPAGHSVEFQLRLAGEPYTTYLSKVVKTTGVMQQVTFEGVAPETAEHVVLLFRMTGSATLNIDNIQVEKLTTAQAAAAKANAPDETILDEDFNSASLGKPPAQIIDDSAWAGSKVPMQIVDSGNAQYGKVLQCKVSGFGQLNLGSVRLVKGEAYRVSVDISSAGQHQAELYLRLAPSPYTTYLTTNVQTSESFKHFTFTGIAPATSDSVSFMLKMNGETLLTIDNIKVEKLGGGLPKGAEPTTGNMVLNAGFELGRDGWLLDDPADIGPVADAFEGRNAAKVPVGEYLYSPWMELSYISPYITEIRAKAVGQPITVNLMVTNLLPFAHDQKQDIHGKTMRLTPEQGWQTVGFTWKPIPEIDAYRPTARYYLKITCDGPAGASMLVDATQMQAEPEDGKTPAYAPHATVERALSTDMPQNVATQGEPVTLKVHATGPDGPVRVVIHDEHDKELRTLNVPTSNGQGTVKLSDLPNGFWHLLTVDSPPPANGQSPNVQGEAFIAIVPPMPSVAIDEWGFGTHVPNVARLRKAFWKVGLRINRLHDVSGITKWTYVEPKPGVWHFDDKAMNEMRTEGEGILGVVNEVPKWIRTPEQMDKLYYQVAISPTMDPGFVKWSTYVEKTVAHWRDQVTDWEVMNEPNFANITPAEYIAIMKATTTAIRRGNPKAVVVGLGGPLIDSEWLAKAIELGVGKLSDAVSFHGYNDIALWRVSNGPKPLIDAVNGMRKQLADAGSPNMPIWNTEFGTGVQSSFTKFETFPLGSTAMAAAVMMPKSVAAATAANIQKTYYYAGFDYAGPHQAGYLGWMNDLNGTIQACMQPTAVAIAQIVGREYKPVPDSGQPGLVHLSFTGRGATVHMLWANDKPLTAPTPAGAKEILNMWGRTIPPAAQLQLTNEPVYVIVPDGGS